MSISSVMHLLFTQALLGAEIPHRVCKFGSCNRDQQNLIHDLNCDAVQITLPPNSHCQMPTCVDEGGTIKYIAWMHSGCVSRVAHTLMQSPV